MIFLAILDCKDKGLKESTRLCSKYLNQIGHKAFIGNLSTNNFNNFIEEMKLSMKYNINSVTIYRVKKSEFKLIHHFGHHTRLDENGLFAFKLKDQVELKKLKNQPTSPAYKMLKEIVAISGYLHDLGKSSAAFQNLLECSRKLSKTNAHLSKKFLFEEDNDETGEIYKKDSWNNLIRHELMSYIILKDIIVNGVEEDGKMRPFVDKEFFEVMSDQNKVECLFNKALQRLEDAQNNPSEFKNKENGEISLLFSLQDAINKNIGEQETETVAETIINYTNKDAEKLLFKELSLESHTEDSKKEDLFENNFMGQDQFYINLILFLVLTHHRLPEPTSNDISKLDKFSISTYCNDKHKLHYKYYFKLFLNCHEKDNQELYNGKNWNELFSSSCKSALDLLNDEKNKLNTKEVQSAIFEYSLINGRLSLIISDYYKSKEKSIKDEDEMIDIIKNNIAIANIETINSSYNSTGVENLVMGDTLTEHLMKVGCETYKVIPDILLDGFKNTHHYSTITKEDRDLYINKKIEEGKKNNLKRFDWQYKTMESLNDQNFKNKPFFGISVAGTGSGKTNSNLMTMMALDDNPRFTCALGLRTLTLQSFKSYQEEPLIKEGTALFIGKSLESEVLDENESKKNDSEDVRSDSLSSDDNSVKEKLKKEQNVYTGSDSEKMIENDDYDVVELQKVGKKYTYNENKEHQDWFSILDDKSKRIIHAPIAVMTVDNIAKGVQYGRGHNLLNMNRTITSDLILDEIDDYSNEDMATMLKLVYATALSGRKVLISSATVSEVVVNTLFTAYLKGIKHREVMFNEKIDFGCGMISQYVEVNKIKSYTTKKASDFLNDYRGFLSDLGDAIFDKNNEVNKEKTQRNKSEILDLSSAFPILTEEDKKDKDKDLLESRYKTCFNIILKKANEYSTKFYTNLPDSDKKVSFGFVRFNNIKTSQQFAEYALKNNEEEYENVKILVLNYHSRMMGLDRYIIEDLLGSVLKRKQNNDQDLHSHENFPAIKNHVLFEKIKNIKESNIMILVSSTNILEVGRDHDYDWAILEYQSMKSLVQSQGRVRRHRTLETKEANIAYLSHHIKVIKTNDINSGYKNFGLLDNDDNNLFAISREKTVSCNNCMNYKDFFNNFNKKTSNKKAAPNFSLTNKKKEKSKPASKCKQKSLPPKDIVQKNIVKNEISNINTLKMSNIEYKYNRGLTIEQLRLLEMFTSIKFKIDGNMQTELMENNVYTYIENPYTRMFSNYTSRFSFRGMIYKNKTFILNHSKYKEVETKQKKKCSIWEESLIKKPSDYYERNKIGAKTSFKKSEYEFNVEFKKVERSKNSKNEFLIDFLYIDKMLKKEDEKEGLNDDINKIISCNFKSTKEEKLLDLLYSFNCMLHSIETDSSKRNISYTFNLGLT